MVSGGEGGVGSTSDVDVGGTGMVCSSADAVGSSTGISELMTLVLRSSVSSCSEGRSEVSSTASASEGAGGSAQVVVTVGVASSADVMDSTETSAGLG